MPLLQSGDVPNFQEGGLGQAGSRASVPTLERSATPTVGAGTEPFEYRAYKGPSVNFSEGLGGFGAIALKLQKDVDNARVTEKLTLLKKYAIDRRQGENGFLKKEGIDALNQDDDGNGLAEQEDIALVQYGESLQEDLTPNQRKLLQQKMVELRNQQYAFATQHVLQQNQNYMDTQNKVAHEENVTLAAASYSTPDVLDSLVRSSVEQVESYGERHGWSREQINVQIRKSVGELYASAVNGAIVDSDKDVSNLSFAQSILDRRGSEMTGEMVVKLRNSLNNVQSRVETLTVGKDIARVLGRDNSGTGTVGSFYSGGGSTAGNFIGSYAVLGSGPQGEGSGVSWQIGGSNEAWGRAGALVFDTALMRRESGGRQHGKGGAPLVGRYKDGTKPREGNQAYGAGQVTPDTAKFMCKQMGWEYDFNRLVNDKGYNLGIARAYSGWLCQYYKGDAIKAIAAYGAGTGNVNAAVKAAEKDGKPDQWLDYLYAREGNYKDKAGNLINANHSKFDSREDVMKAVKNAREALSGVKRDPATKQELNPFDPETYKKNFRGFSRKEAETLAAKAFPGNPLKQEQAVDYAMREQERNKQDFIRRETEAIGKAAEYLMSGEEIPQSVWAEMTPAAQLKAMQMRKAMQADPDGYGDPSLYWHYEQNQGKLVGMSETEARMVAAQLPKNKQTPFLDMYYKVNEAAKVGQNTLEQNRGASSQGVNLPGYGVNTGAAREAARGAMNEVLGVGKFDDLKKPAQEYLTGIASDIIREAQQNSGRVFKTDSERIDYVRATIAQRFDVRGFGNFEIFRSNKTVFEVTAGDLRRADTSGTSNAFQVLRQITKNKFADRGSGPDYEPTDEQIRKTFIELMTMRHPYSNLHGVTLDSVTEDYIREEYDRKVRRNSFSKRNTELSDIDLLRYYVLLGLSGQKIPHTAASSEQREDYFGATEFPEETQYP